MKKADAIAKITALSDDAELIVRTPEEDAEFVKKAAAVEGKKLYEADVNQLTNRHFQEVEDAIFEAVGERKDPTEKASAFAARLAKKYKPLAEKAAQLEADIAAGKGNEAMAKKLREVQDNMEAIVGQAKEEKKRLERELASERENGKKIRIRAELSKHMGGFQYLDTVPAPVRENFVNTALDEIVNMGDFDGDRLIFKDSQGTVLRNNYEVVTAKDILSDKLKPILDAGRQQQGGGGKPPAKPAMGSAFVLPATARIKEDVSNALQAAGYKRDSKEYVELYRQHAKDLPEKLD